MSQYFKCLQLQTFLLDVGVYFESLRNWLSCLCFDFFKRWCKLNYFVFSPQIKSRLTFCIFKSVRIIPNVSHNKGTKTFKGLSKEIKNVLNTVLPHLHIAIITSFSLENIEGQKVNKISWLFMFFLLKCKRTICTKNSTCYQNVITFTQ